MIKHKYQYPQKQSNISKIETTQLHVLNMGGLKPRTSSSLQTGDWRKKKPIRSYSNGGFLLSVGHHAPEGAEVTALTPLAAKWQLRSLGRRRGMHREVLVPWQRGLWSSIRFYSLDNRKMGDADTMVANAVATV